VAGQIRTVPPCSETTTARSETAHLHSTALYGPEGSPTETWDVLSVAFFKSSYEEVKNLFGSTRLCMTVFPCLNPVHRLISHKLIIIG
jgi:hypothetical protein